MLAVTTAKQESHAVARIRYNDEDLMCTWKL